MFCGDVQEYAFINCKLLHKLQEKWDDLWALMSFKVTTDSPSFFDQPLKLLLTLAV